MKQMELEPEPRALRVATLREAIVISPEGACDQKCTEELDGVIRKIEGVEQKNIILDASRLKYIDTPGFRWIIDQCRKLQEFGGSLIIAGLKGPAERAFKLLQLEKFIPAVANVEGAIARLRRKGAAGS